MMNYNFTTVKTQNDPYAYSPCVQDERESLKVLMRTTNERLNEAIEIAEAILSEVRGAFPQGDEERASVNSAMDAERLNRDKAERLCSTLKEIAMQIGVEA